MVGQKRLAEKETIATHTEVLAFKYRLSLENTNASVIKCRERKRLGILTENVTRNVMVKKLVADTQLRLEKLFRWASDIEFDLFLNVNELSEKIQSRLREIQLLHEQIDRLIAKTKNLESNSAGDVPSCPSVVPPRASVCANEIYRDTHSIAPLDI